MNKTICKTNEKLKVYINVAFFKNRYIGDVNAYRGIQYCWKTKRNWK